MHPSSTSQPRRSPVDVFRFLDYRAYLAEYYRTKKPRGFSYRAFSRTAGLGAPNYLKLVIEGQRNLTASMAQRFATACGLSGEAHDYFCELVTFNQSSGTREQNESYGRLTAFRRYRRAQKLEVAQASYHSNWYLPAIRELVASPKFQEDPAWIAEMVWPAIRPVDARQAIDTLLELGLLERDDDGELKQSSAVVSTGPETQGMHIGNYHREMMKQAAASIDTIPAAQRDISSLTMCLGPKGLSRLKERIQQLRRELLELSEAETQGAQVVQLNLQLFPLSHVAQSPTDDVEEKNDDNR